jgi:phosphatidylglycerol:prolipoprotein diacylglycerol transferase
MREVLFKIGDFPLYSYPLFFGMAWGIGISLSFRLVELSKKYLMILLVGCFISSWFGAKFLFFLFSSSSLDFISGGGFVFYGGLIFSLFYLWIFNFFCPQSSLRKLARLSIAVCFAQAVGRIGCFFAGCCYGSEGESFWCIFLYGKYRHPVQIYEALGLILLGFYLWKNKKRNLSYRYLLGYGFLRLFSEMFRGDALRGVFPSGLSYAQIISLLLIFLGVYFYKKDPDRQRVLAI